MFRLFSNAISSFLPTFIVAGLLGLSISAQALETKKLNVTVLGCWGDADKGDSLDLKIHFIGNGSLIQYDENKVEKQKRSFGAWEMHKSSQYLKVFWPTGGTSQFYVKRMGPILHFKGMRGARSFTLRAITSDNCWEPRT